MHKNTKWSAVILGASLAMTAAMPAIPAMAASHHGAEHGGHGKHGLQSKDRLKVTRSTNHVTAPEAALLSGLSLPQGTASALFAQGTPFTVYTVRIVGPHAHWSGTGSITVSDNNGGLTTPADLYYLGFERGVMHPDPFRGDTTPYNASTVGQSSSFSVHFVRGRAQFAVFDGQSGSGPIQITVKDQALNQSKTVTYPDVATTTATSTAPGTFAQPVWSANTPNASNVNADFANMFGSWGIFSLSTNGQKLTFNEGAITSQVKTNNGDWQSPTASPWKAPVVFKAPTAGATETSISATLNGSPVSSANLPFTSLNTDTNFSAGSDALAWLPQNMQPGNWVFKVQWSSGQVMTYNVTVNAAAGTIAEPQWSANTPNATSIQTDFNNMYTSATSGGWGIFSLAGNGQSVTFNESAITSQVKTNNGDWQSPTASPWKAPVVFKAPTAGATETSISATLNGSPVSSANLPFTSLNTDANFSAGSDALAWLPENMQSGTWVFTVQWSNGQVVNYTVTVQ